MLPHPARLGAEGYARPSEAREARQGTSCEGRSVGELAAAVEGRTEANRRRDSAPGVGKGQRVVPAPLCVARLGTCGDR